MVASVLSSLRARLVLLVLFALVPPRAQICVLTTWRSRSQ